VNAPAPLIALYHRAVTFGGSFNSVVDVLSRVDRTRFAPVAAVPGPGSASARAVSAKDMAGRRAR